VSCSPGSTGRARVRSPRRSTGASGFLKEGLSVAAEAGDETSVVYYLESVAAVAGRQDNSRRAVRLLAAAAAMLQARGSGWLHAYVPRAAHKAKRPDHRLQRSGL
jgi:hypothetical protein